MPIPREVFRENLRRLAKLYDLDSAGLATALRFNREDRKWLNRAWHSGLAREDPRTSHLLHQLATFCCLDDPGHFWVPDVEPNPEKLARSLDETWVWWDIENHRETEVPPSNIVDKVSTKERIGWKPNRRWFALVDKVALLKRIIDRLRIRYPTDMDMICQLYESEHEMIAYWVAAQYGNNRLTKEENDILARIEDEYSLALGLEIRTDPIEHLRKRVSQHPNFPDMVERMCRTLKIEATTWSDDYHKRNYELAVAHDEEHGGQTEAPLPVKFFSYLDKRIYESMNRPLSLDEVFDRFAKRYLDSEDTDDSSEMLLSILAELQAHSEWDKHVRVAYDDDDVAARAAVAEKWKKAQEVSGHTISVIEFVDFYRSHILDILKKRDDTEPGDLGGNTNN